jgi:acyl-CoA reductase-like NAD-dependent aldehyde dehydrogenase
LDAKITLGPLSNKKQYDSIVKQVQDSIDKGAKVLYGDLDFKIQDSNL